MYYIWRNGNFNEPLPLSHSNVAMVSPLWQWELIVGCSPLMCVSRDIEYDMFVWFHYWI